MTLLDLRALALLLAAAAAQATPPSIEDFQRPPAFSGPVLSPDGRHIAAIVNPDGKTTALAVIATDKPGEATPLKAFGQADIRSVHWIDNERLAFTVRPRVDGEGRAIGAGLWTLDRQGGSLRQWVNPSTRGSREDTPQVKRALDANWSLFQAPDVARPGELVLRHYVPNVQRELSYVELARLDPSTGERKLLTEGAPDHVMDWVLDAAGNPAFAFSSNGRGGSLVHWRTPEGRWAVWHEQADDEPYRRPLAIDRAGRPYLLVNENGRMALHRADNLAPDAPTTRLAGSTVYSLWPRLLRDADSDDLLGVQFDADVPQTAWFAPALAGAQAEIDRRLPGAANLISCLRCLAVPTVLVTSFSDRRPVRYFLFNRETGQLTGLAASMPWMPEGRPRQVASTAARDGLRLPLIVTHPAQPTPGPAPTVLLVHGGPWVRGNHWPWQPEPQFYASRGYLVLEVDYRGSTGYGVRHERAGDKQWGLKMQDDLDDAVAWAVKQGLTDPKRVCIVGASYGGYAALIGLSRGQMACAVASLAPTDLTKLTSRHWSDARVETLAYSLPRRLGDPVVDAAQLKASSPIQRIDQLQGPLLMLYGALDTRVPLAHGTELRDALTAAGRPPEFVAYPNEGHGFYKWEHQQDAWRRIDAFLATHLAPKP
ncbi:MAG: S9 family peptidase [Pelomonas sp.]|nr:S9 family peptidase [Roseateles sp.]